MKIIDLDRDKAKVHTVVGLGNFDGVHLAHQELAKKVAGLARHKTEQIAAILLFKNHPRHKIGFRYLSSMDDKIHIMDQLGIEIIFLIEFSKEFAALSPESFIENILNEKCLTRHIVVGTDYSFGKDGKGDTGVLDNFQNKYNYKLHVIDDVKMGGSLVSSSRIRKNLTKGHVEEANAMLGRPYSIKGRVIRGKGRGKNLRYPTANLHLDFEYLIPKEGVYHTLCKYEGRTYNSMTSIGKNPTFEQGKEISDPTIEIYIDNFSKEIYGDSLELSFIKYLRNMIKFETSTELVDQLDRDLVEIRQLSNLYKQG